MRFLTARWHDGEVAFAVVILAGYAMIFTSGENTLAMRNITLLLLLGLVFLSAGVFGSRYLDFVNKKSYYYCYYVFQLSLGVLIGFLSSGTTYLILLPICSQAIENLPHPHAIAIALLVWLGQLAPFVWLAGWIAFRNWGPPMAAAVVFVAVFSVVTVSERKAKLALKSANEKLRIYAAQVEELATAEERNRLAREIHDGLGHYLTAINIQIKAAQATFEVDSHKADSALKKAQSLSQEALAEVRRSVSALRTDPATSLPLLNQIQPLISESRGAGIETDFSTEGNPYPLNPQAAQAVFRTIQEGLTNIRKHSHASRAMVTLIYQPNCIILSIRDNGQGSSECKGGYGLVGLRERVALLNGKMVVSTAPGKGFHLTVEIPEARIELGTL